MASPNPLGTDESAGTPAGRNALVSRLKGTLQTPRGRWVAIAAGGTAALLGLTLLVTILSGPGSVGKTRDLVTRLVARDAAAAEMLSDPADLGSMAWAMGLAGLPGSVAVSVEDFEGKTVSDMADVKIGGYVPGGDQSPAGPGVAATYTLVLSGPDGSLGKYDQEMWVLTTQDQDGTTLLDLVGVKGQIDFDMADYFGTDGTSTAEVDAVIADLRAGTSWVPGAKVTTTSETYEYSVPDAVTILPPRLTTWSVTASEAVPGVKSRWTVRVDMAGAGNAVVVGSVSPATVVAREAIPTQIIKGGLDPDVVIGQAMDVARGYNTAIDSGDAAAANALVRGAKVQITASGLAHDKAQERYCDVDKPEASDDGSLIEVKMGSCTVSLAPDGSWFIDGMKSLRVATVIPGNGKVATVYGAQYLPGAPFPMCTNRISIKLVHVRFYTDGSAMAVFNFRYSNETSCSVGDRVAKATVGWKGNKGVSVSPWMDGSSEAWMDLPEGVTPGARPIWIKFTRYETDDGNALGYTLTFYTK
jgi:hypothetical protein